MQHGNHPRRDSLLTFSNAQRPKSTYKICFFATLDYAFCTFIMQYCNFSKNFACLCSHIYTYQSTRTNERVDALCVYGLVCDCCAVSSSRLWHSHSLFPTGRGDSATCRGRDRTSAHIES